MKAQVKGNLVRNDNLEDSIRVILEEIGENPQREGLLDTPKRGGKPPQQLAPSLSRNVRCD